LNLQGGGATEKRSKIAKKKNSIINPLPGEREGGGQRKKDRKTAKKDQKNSTKLLSLYLLLYICTMYGNPGVYACPPLPMPVYTCSDLEQGN